MRTCFTTTLDDKYISGFLITLNSLLKTSPSFNYDIIVLEWGELSDESKDLISKLYKNVKYKRVEAEKYQTHTYDNTWRTWTYNCNYRFDIFLLEEYDRIVFFDADMIFEIDVEEILSHNVDFGACPAVKNSIMQLNTEQGFDAGIMLIGKKYITPQTREELLKLAQSEPPSDPRVKTKNWISDEPILNHYFLDKMTWLPVKFNYVTPLSVNVDLNSPKNYQYVGHNKPWYGEKFEEQFDSGVIRMINEKNKPFERSIVFKKLIKKYKDQVKDLLEKEIDIKKYSDRIKPIL